MMNLNLFILLCDLFQELDEKDLNVEKMRHWLLTTGNDAAVLLGLLALASAVAISSITFPGS